MTDRSRPTACDEFRPLIHATLDGDLMEAEASRRLHVHLAACDDCRRFESGLRRIQFALRDLGGPSMPDDAFDEVLERTVRARGGWGRLLDWRVAAAAAILVFAAWNFWPGATNAPSDGPRLTNVAEVGIGGEPTEAELREADAQLRMILNRTGNALERSGQSCRELLGEQLAPALQRIPIHLPAATDSAETSRGKSKT